MSRVVFGIPPALTGRLIGKGGSTINDLQKTTGTTITISDGGIVVVEGQNVAAAIQKIESAVGVSVVPSGERLVTEVVSVPKNAIGLIIGPGGSTIKKLRASTGVSVDVKEGEGVVLEGGEVGVRACHKKLQNIVGESLNILSSHSVVVQGEQLLDLKNDSFTESIFFPDTKDGEGLARFLLFLKSAVHSMDVCVFSITDDRISRCLSAAASRGVKVRIITDDDQMKTQGSDIKTLAKSGCQVKTDHTPAHMHHKFAILDGRVVMNGSFNWTRNASSHNQENVMIFSDPILCAQFQKHFTERWAEF